MNRRGFLKFLGLAPVVAAAVTSLPAKLMNMVEPLPETPEIGGWVSYSFRYVICPAPPDSMRFRRIDVAIV